ncbi:MAG: 50S ribosomal protein L20 [bacterium]|nr:50S ribosomal protein L20 [bacterium]
MARVKRGVTRKLSHKKVLKSTKGYRGAKNRLFRVAKEASMHAGAYAYAGRRLRRRDFRTSWISTISAALTETQTNYSNFLKALKEAKVELDRKTLANIAANDPSTFKKVVEKVLGK